MYVLEKKVERVNWERVKSKGQGLWNGMTPVLIDGSLAELQLHYRSVNTPAPMSGHHRRNHHTRRNCQSQGECGQKCGCVSFKFFNSQCYLFALFISYITKSEIAVGHGKTGSNMEQKAEMAFKLMDR